MVVGSGEEVEIEDGDAGGDDIVHLNRRYSVVGCVMVEEKGCSWLVSLISTDRCEI